MRSAAVILLAAAALLSSCTGTGHHAGRAPHPAMSGASHGANPPALRGRPLSGDTGLRLISDGSILDLDTGRTRPVTGLTPSGRAIDAFAVAGATMISATCTDRRPCTNEVFVLARDGFHVTRLATNASGAPGRAGVWVDHRKPGGRCTLSEMTAGRRTLVPPAPISCGVTVVGETRDGVLTAGGAVLDPRHHLRVINQAGGPILAVAGSTVITNTNGSMAVTEADG
ncbi:MAG TPA: hypothetical protein VHC49_06355 [Mycobacteriales bacterium]|nr:hypothetical protein [Mycobacteriales bacterium]